MFAEFSWADSSSNIDACHPAEGEIIRKKRKQIECNGEDHAAPTTNGGPSGPDHAGHNSVTKTASSSFAPIERERTLRYSERLAHDIDLTFPVDEVIYKSKTEYQDVQIFRTPHFGLCLVMDNHMQSAEADEKVYHESLVHPALLSHPNPKKVFIGGGGEGGTLREVLKHKSVEKVVMVDIDQKATELCMKYLPGWSEGGFDDKRTQLIFGDAKRYLEESDEVFDVIIVDICDPIEQGPGWQLYTKEFYEKTKKNLSTQNGILVTQATSTSVNTVTECFTVINNTLKQVFKNVNPYRSSIPSFGTPWAFVVCSDGGGDSDAGSSEGTTFLPVTKDMAPSVVDERISERMEWRKWDRESSSVLPTEVLSGKDCLIYYDGDASRHMFSMAKYEKKALDDETRVLTLDNPIYMI